MVVTKHFAIHGKNYRSKLIKYILNPSKTKKFTLVSDFGMGNYLDFPSHAEKANQLHVHIDFSRKHSRFMMTDRAMTKPIRGRQLSK